MDQESFILVHDTQRKCFYLTLASALKNTEGLKVVAKFPNSARAVDALQKYASGQKVFGTMTPDKLNLKDALGEEYDDEETYSSSAKGQKINRSRAEQEMKNSDLEILRLFHLDKLSLRKEKKSL